MQSYEENHVLYLGKHITSKRLEIQSSCGDTAAVFVDFQNKMDVNALPFNALAI
jgi:hypothetical protein